MDHSFYSDRDITENYLDGPSYRPGPARCSGPTSSQLLHALLEPTPEWVLEAPGGWRAPSDLTGQLGHETPRRQLAPRSSSQPHTAPRSAFHGRTVTR